MNKGESVSRSSEFSAEEILPMLQKHLCNMEEALYFFSFTVCPTLSFSSSPTLQFSHIASLLSPLTDALRRLEHKTLQIIERGDGDEI